MANGKTKNTNIVIGSHRRGTSSGNLYIDIAKQGTGTLKGDSVDPKLVKADQLLAYTDGMSRPMNEKVQNTMFSAGELDAEEVTIEILRTPASVFLENSCSKADVIGPIVIFRTDTINGKLEIKEEITFEKCTITAVDTNFTTLEGDIQDTIQAKFHFIKRKRVSTSFDQEGKKIGNNVSYIDFEEGALKAPGA